MSEIEIILGDRWKDRIDYLHGLRPNRPVDTNVDLSAIRDVIDIVIDGRNITSYIDEERLFDFFYTLSNELLRLLSGHSQKAVIEFPSQPWELAILPSSPDLLLSVYSIDRKNRIAAHNEDVTFTRFVKKVIETSEKMMSSVYDISEVLKHNEKFRDFNNKIAELKSVLRDGDLGGRSESYAERGLHHGSVSRPPNVTIQYWLDADSVGLRAYEGENMFDLHALLTSGDVVAEVGNEQVPICTTYPFLFVDGLLSRLRDLLSALEKGGTESHEFDAPIPHCGLRIQQRETEWRLIFGTGEDALAVDRPAGELLELLVSLAEMILSDLISINPKLDLNHRFTDLTDKLDRLDTWRAEQTESNIYHFSPETYIEDRGHWRALRGGRPPAPSYPRVFDSVNHLFARLSWQISTDKIFFKAIEPTSEGILVPFEQKLEMCDWETGDPRWRVESSPGEQMSFSVLPDKLLLMREESGVESLHLESGEPIFSRSETSLRSSKRIIQAAEYSDEDLIVTVDSHGRIFGIESQSGDVEWHFGPKHGRLTGIAFQGPIISVLSSEGVLYSLDPECGEILWKVRLSGTTEREPFFHEGRLYVISRDCVTNKSTLHSFYPYTGREAWRLRFRGRVSGQMSFNNRWGFLPIEHNGELNLTGIDLEAPQPALEWSCALSSAGIDPPTRVSDAVVDETRCGIVKTDRNELTCFEVETGAVVWREKLRDQPSFIHQKLPVIQIRDAILVANEKLELRQINNGKLLHQIDYPVRSPVYLTAGGCLNVVVGEMASSTGKDDRLLVFALNHFLTEVVD